ncbi:MAG TPA: hypothetical protein VLL69_10530 [Streptosporangiaceae bacterium]|nr:hypothetical protein [Streptosporangiaceae bacterium]
MAGIGRTTGPCEPGQAEVSISWLCVIEVNKVRARIVHPPRSGRTSRHPPSRG